MWVIKDIAVVLDIVPSVASIAAALAILSATSFPLMLTFPVIQCKVIDMSWFQRTWALL